MQHRGGKGLNVARVAKACGSDVQATGLVGGFNGRYLESLAQADGITSNFGHIAGETRSCINVLDPKYRSTEYLEPGTRVSSEELDAYLDEFPSIIADSDVVTLSGSLPAGVGADTYQRLVRLVKDAGKQVILDTSGEALRLGIEAGPTMIKPNRNEIEALFGITVTSRDDVISYARRLHEGGVANVVVSLGGEGALLSCDEGTYQAIPPEVKVENTVGCGDSMVAAFAVALERGMGAREALSYAVAVGSAAAMSPNTGDYDPSDRDDILPKVEVRTIGGGGMGHERALRDLRGAPPHLRGTEHPRAQEDGHAGTEGEGPAAVGVRLSDNGSLYELSVSRILSISIFAKARSRVPALSASGSACSSSSSSSGATRSVTPGSGRAAWTSSACSRASSPSSCRGAATRRTRTCSNLLVPQQGIVLQRIPWVGPMPLGLT